MDEEYLAHYGVLGMKWGVRHNPQRAYERSQKKLGKYKKRIAKYNVKANKSFTKGVDRSGGLFSSQKRANKAFAKSKKYSRKALRTTQKASRWIQRMEKEFSKQSTVSIDKATIDLGQQYINRITSAADQMYLRNL